MSEELLEQLKTLTGVEGPRITAADEVCKPMIRHWCEAMQDSNPLYTDEEYAKRSKYGSIIAPPAMLMAWVFPPLWPPLVPPEGPLDRAMVMLDEAGFTQVIITGTSQKYLRPLYSGDRVSFTYQVDSVSPERQTALGTGYFVTTTFTYGNQNGEAVGIQVLTMLKYRSGA